MALVGLSFDKGAHEETYLGHDHDFVTREVKLFYGFTENNLRGTVGVNLYAI